MNLVAVIGRIAKERSEPFTLHQLQDPFKAARQSFAGNYRLDFGAGQRAYIMNPKFKQTYAIAMAIPKRKNKKLAILAWCAAAKKALK